MRMRLGIGLNVLALMMCAGCAFMSERAELWDEWRNEVVSGDVWGVSEGHYVINLEQANVLTNNTAQRVDVYVDSSPLLQAYRIAGGKVFNCRWINDDNSYRVVTPETRKAIRQLTNRLEQQDISSQPLASDSVVTITRMSWSAFTPRAFRLTLPTWSYWDVCQWVETSDKAPAVIETFRQAIEQAVSAPECKKNYRSYLRAIPLITKEALEAEKDTPLIDLATTRYHVKNAVGYPYLLIPIPGRGTPFYSTARKYTPGDKFKVRYGRDGEYYFLVETFKGEAWRD